MTLDTAATARRTDTDRIVAAELTGSSATIRRVRELIQRAAALGGGVLLTAERGIDVDAVARALHDAGPRTDGPFVAIDCAGAGPRDVDVRLFGDVPPAGSDLETIAPACALHASSGGTLFLRSIADLPAGAQARLARIVRDGEVRIDHAIVRLDVSFVASAGPTIDLEVDANRVRHDLCRRLSACRIDLPALHDRPDDVAAVATRIVEDLCAARRVPTRRLTDATLSLFAALAWPGNLAELHSVIERALETSAGEEVRTEHVLPALGLHRARAPFTPSGNLRDARLRFERDYISAVLQHHGWRMADAAVTLGIQRPNLYRKARQLGIPLTRVPE
jgi:DNA-binding NtrC family response regulator